MTRVVYTEREKMIMGVSLAMIMVTLGMTVIVGAYLRNPLVLAFAGFGLGQVWGNTQAAMLHEMRHEAEGWVHGSLPWIIQNLRRYHNDLHHKVAGIVESIPANRRTPQQQQALDLSSRLGVDTFAYLFFQSLGIWAPVALIVWMVFGQLSLALIAAFVAGTLFSCLTEDGGHVWNHSPKWRQAFVLRFLWDWVFSTEPQHGRHHALGKDQTGHYGSYPWCTAEKLLPGVAQAIFKIQFGTVILGAWLSLPIFVCAFWVANPSVLMGLLSVSPALARVLWHAYGMGYIWASHATMRVSRFAERLDTLLTNSTKSTTD